MTEASCHDVCVQRCFGEAGATEKVVQAILKFGTTDLEVKTWAYKAIVSLAASEDIDPAMLKAASSFKDVMKLLKRGEPI